MEIFLPNLVNGISYSMLLFLIASGLSLIFGVMGTLNLAHGALYMLGAYIGLTVTRLGGNWLLGLLAAGISIALVGLLLDKGLLSRLYKQINEQVLLTIGLVYIFANVVLWVWGPWPKLGVPPSILSGSVDVFEFSMPIYRLALILIGGFVFAALWWFQDKTRFGAIIRAGMDDKEMTTGLGINYTLVSSLVFMLGAFMGGMAGFLGAPISAAFPEMSMSILLLALIVIIVGGVGNVQGTLLGAIVIGLIDSFGKAYFPDFAMFTIYLVMIIVLLVRPSGILGREQIAAGAPPVPVGQVIIRGRLGVVRPAWQQRLISYAPYILVGAVLIVLPPFGGADIRSMLAKVLIFGIFAMSLNLVFGYTGLFSLGHAAFFGVGGYTAAILLTRLGIDNFWAVLPVSILAAAIFAAIFGFIALRVSGVYFLLVTLALGQLLYSVAIKWFALTGGSNGIRGIPYPDLGLPFTMNATSFYYFVFVIFIICYFLLSRLVNSPFGHALQGIREDERRMQCLGYNTWLYKYIAFIIAGVFAGVAGMLFGSHSSIVVPTDLGITTSVLVFLMVIIGSTNVVFGPALGAAVVVLLEHYVSIYTPERWPLILGGVFVLAVMFLRGGISIYLVNLLNKIRRNILGYSYVSSKA